MFTLKVENDSGDLMELTHNKSYKVINIEGLNPPKATIYTSENALFDGSTFNYSKVNTRNIVLTIIIEGNIETNRILLYKYFRPKKFCRLYLKTNARNVYIDGYAESVEIDLFAMKQMAQISIICLNPFFSAVDETVTLFNGNTVVNDGDTETGMVFGFRFSGATNGFTLRNVNTDEKMIISGIQIDSSKIFTVNTNRGQKKIVDNSGRNYLRYLSYGSTWLQLPVGSSTFDIEADAPFNVLSDVRFRKQYEGV